LKIFEADQVEVVEVNRVILELNSQDVDQKDDFRVLMEEVGALARTDVSLR